MDTYAPRWLSADEQQTWRSFVCAFREFFAAVDTQLQRDAGMPLAYYEILVQLSESPGRAMRMTQLADAAGASKSRASHAVARLEERGWVRREECPTDRRGQIALLTDDGFAALAAAAPRHVEHVRHTLFDALSPEQVARLREISAAIDAAARQAASAAGSDAPEGGPAGDCPPPCGEPCPDGDAGAAPAR